MSDNVSRRKFIKSVALAAIAVPFLQKLSLLGISNAHAESLAALSESDPLAKTIKYCVDAEKSIKSKTSACPDRKLKDRSGQLCRGCQLYTKFSGDGAAEVGKCLIVPGKTVAANSWCMSWVKKPA
jgi:hypothetical protein